MTSKTMVIQMLLLCVAVGLSSCAKKPPAETVSRLSQAQEALHQADKSKAPEYASLELHTAREQFAAAQEAMKNREYTHARRLAERALVNAELAETVAEAEETRRTAQELRQSIQALGYEAGRQAAH
jgi:hypothetical protein